MPWQPGWVAAEDTSQRAQLPIAIHFKRSAQLHDIIADSSRLAASTCQRLACICGACLHPELLSHVLQ